MKTEGAKPVKTARVTDKLSPTKWKPGQSGNPKGKPIGARNKMTLLAATLMDRDLDQIAEKIIAASLAGDLDSCKFVLSRMLPARKDLPITLDLPPATTAQGVTEAQATILAAVAKGEITPTEGSILATIIEQHRKAIETLSLEQRIAALEASKP